MTLTTGWLLPGRGAWNPPVWSLSVEIIGYLFFPLFAFLVNRVRSTALASSMAVGSCVAFVAYLTAVHHLGQNVIEGPSAIVRMFCVFFAGIALYRARQLSGQPYAEDLKFLIVVGAFSVIALLFIQYGVSFEPLAFLLLIAGLGSLQTSWAYRLFSNRISMALGRLSFPLYLVHLNVIFWFKAHSGISHHPVMICSVIVAISAAAAWLLHVTVERPFARLAHRGSRGSIRDRAALVVANS